MIRIFIGTSEIHEHRAAEIALRESILANTIGDYSISFTWMRAAKNGYWKPNGCTTFTNYRFAVPYCAGYEGYAIYLDVDMIVLGDIAELWAMGRQGAWCTTETRDDVSVIDCGAFRDMPKPSTLNKFKKDELRRRIGNRKLQCIPNAWNSIDKVDIDTKLIHYSDLDRQPWQPIPGHNYKPHPDPVAVGLFWEYHNRASKL